MKFGRNRGADVEGYLNRTANQQPVVRASLRFGVLAASEVAAKSASAAAEIAAKTGLAALEIVAKAAMVTTEIAVRGALLPITLPTKLARHASITVDNAFEAGDRALDEVFSNRLTRFAAYAGSAALVGAGAIIGHKVGLPQSGNEWLAAGGAVELAAVGLGTAANVGVTRNNL